LNPASPTDRPGRCALCLSQLQAATVCIFMFLHVCVVSRSMDFGGLIQINK